MNLRIHILILIIWSVNMNAQTVLYDDPDGESHTNTDMPITDVTPTVDITNCTSIEFSIDYEFPAGWEGSGNMEYLDECCAACAGDPENSLDPPCLQNLSCTGTVGCWDFMWIQFFIDGDAVTENLIGDSGTTDAENMGTFSYIQCLDGNEDAHIEIVNHNSAAAETNIYTNVSIICWEAQPMIEDLDPVCNADLDLIGDAVDPAAVASWEWSTDGPADISDETAQSTTASDALDGDTFTLTTTDVNDCTAETSVEFESAGFEVSVDGGGVICEGMCTTVDTDFLIDISGGTPLYELSLNVNGIPVPFVPSIDINETIRICADPDIIFPEFDDSSDPIQVTIPSAFFPIDFTLVDIVDADGCSGTILNGDVTYTVEQPPGINEPVPPEYCLAEGDEIDLTVMDDEIGDGEDVLWFEDEDLEDEINNPSAYDVSNGTTVWAVVDNGDCFSEAVEVNLDVDLMPEIEILQNPIIGCGTDVFILPDLEDVVDITNEVNAGYYLDPNGQNGPVFQVVVDDTEEIYIYDASDDDCFDEVVIPLELGSLPIIESPLDQIAGCGMLELPEVIGENIDEYEYNLEEDGSGTSYLAGDFINTSDNITVIYLIAVSEDGCEIVEELDIVLASLIEYNVTIDALLCDSLVLPTITPATGAEAYYTGSMGTGTQLAPGDILYAPFSDTLFIFDPLLDPMCSSEDSLMVNISDGSNPILPTDTTVCEFIVLPEFGGMTGPNIRYAQFPVTDPNSSFYPGDTLDYSQRLYILDTIGNCIYYDSMDVSIVVEPFSGKDTSLVICQGFDSSTFDLMDLLKLPDASGSWTYPMVPDLITNDSSNILLDVLTEGNYTFSYTIEDSICGLFSSDIDVEVIIGPYGGENADIELCAGASIDLMSLINDPDTGGYWEQIMGPETIDIQDSSSVNLLNYQEGRYGFLYVIEGEAFSEFCDGESASLFIDLGSNVYAGSDTTTTVCQGAVVELMDLISADADDTGFFEGDNIIFNGTSWNTSVSDPDQIYDINYIVLSNDINCPNDTALINIELLEQLSAGEAVSPAEACEGSQIDLSNFIMNANTGGYFSLQSDPSTEIANGLWQLDTPTDFYYIIEASGSCPADSLEFTVDLSDNPEFNLAALGSFLCDDNPELSIDLDIQHIDANPYLYEFIIRDATDNSVIFQTDSLSSTNINLQLSTDLVRDGISADTLFISNGVGSYILEVNAYDESGICQDDLDIALPFEIFDAYTETVELQLCEGESYSFDGQIYFNSQTFVVDGGTVNCDSIIRYEIRNYPQVNGSFMGTFCEGEVITILGTDFSQDVNSTEIFTGMGAFGCDSIIDISIDFVSEVLTSFDQSLCEDEELTINNTLYNINNASGTDTLQSVLGCDSILVIDLEFELNTESIFMRTICPGESFDIGTDTYDENNPNGITVLSGQAANGCDSLVMVELELLSSAMSNIQEDICPGQTVQVGPDVYDENNLSGTTILSGQASNGCDSIVNVSLQVSNSVSEDLNLSICQGQSVSVGNDSYDEFNLSGTTVLANQSVNGCDSIVNVELELLLPLADISSPPICPEQQEGEIVITSVMDMSFPVQVILDGMDMGSFASVPITLSASPGAHSITLSDMDGCSYDEFLSLDEISMLDLEINAGLIGQNQFQLNFSSNFTVESNEWISSGFLSCTNCDSPTIAIDEDTEVSMIAVSEEGCELIQTLILNYTAAADSVDYYIPNIISLSDISNNGFNIFSDGNVNIEEITIYDRWGHIMYNNTKFSNPDVLWDGRKNDRLVEQGVYVYKVDLVTDDSEEIQIIGSLTIIR